MPTLASASFAPSKLFRPVEYARYAANPINPYNNVHAGPNTYGGGLNGGCRNARYVFCVSFGRVENPTAVPHAMGKRMAAAGCLKRISGSVRLGM